MMTMTSSSTSSLSSLSATMKKQQQKKKKKKNLAFPSIKDTNRYHRRRGGEISIAACATQPRGRGEEAGAEKREINNKNKNNLNNKEYSFNASRRSNKLNQSSLTCLSSRGKRVIMHSGGGGFSLSKLTSVLKKKTQSDFDRVISGTSKTREKLSYMDEILGLWRFEDLDDTLDDLEETLLSVDFGPKTAGKVLDTIRELVEDGKIKTGEDCKRALKETIVNILVNDGGDPTKMNVSDDEKIPTCVLIIGVNGGGKTTTIGKLSNWYKNAGAKVMMVPGDTFRAAAAEQLQTWADRTGAIIKESAKHKTWSGFVQGGG